MRQVEQVLRACCDADLTEISGQSSECMVVGQVLIEILGSLRRPLMSEGLAQLIQEAAPQVCLPMLQCALQCIGATNAYTRLVLLACVRSGLAQSAGADMDARGGIGRGGVNCRVRRRWN